MDETFILLPKKKKNPGSADCGGESGAVSEVKTSEGDNHGHACPALALQTLAPRHRQPARSSSPT
jgi:hypothetical protein